VAEKEIASERIGKAPIQKKRGESELKLETPRERERGREREREREREPLREERVFAQECVVIVRKRLWQRETETGHVCARVCSHSKPER
jgi:hypothetical protein